MCKYTQKPRVEQKICITQSGDITSEATDVGSRCAANLFAAAEACGICGCRKATVYLQIGCGQATETTLPRRYSICGKQSAAEYTRKLKHLNRDKTRKIHCNSLRNFPLRGFNKHIHRFRCSGKWEHLNRAQTHNSEANQLTANALQNFQQLHPRFRSQPGLEHRRMQMCLGGTSGRGIHQTRNRTAHASEPRQNPRNSLQLIEKLSVAPFQKAHSLVQMQWKRRASEPSSKAESGSQPTHNKCVARLSATGPVVQILDGFGTPQNANVPWRHFWQGYPPNAQQNSTGI